jgi:hypothetical protein
MGDRFARVGCYVAASLVGLGIGGVLAVNAIASGLCNTWGEQCSPDENAEMARLWGLAFAAPVAVIGIYTLVDVIVHAYWRRRSRSGRDGN